MKHNFSKKTTVIIIISAILMLILYLLLNELFLFDLINEDKQYIFGYEDCNCPVTNLLGIHYFNQGDITYDPAKCPKVKTFKFWFYIIAYFSICFIVYFLILFVIRLF